jgi:hypothetical protein
MDRKSEGTPRPFDYAGPPAPPPREPYPWWLTRAALTAAVLLLPVFPVTAVYTQGGSRPGRTEFQSYGTASALEAGLVTIYDVRFERSVGFWLGGPVVLVLAFLGNRRIARWYEGS